MFSLPTAIALAIMFIILGTFCMKDADNYAHSHTYYAKFMTVCSMLCFVGLWFCLVNPRW